LSSRRYTCVQTREPPSASQFEKLRSEADMTTANRIRTRVIAIATLMIAGFSGTALAVDPGVGVGAPGPGARDPGINQPGAAGNTGTPGVGAPGVGAPGVGAPGVGAVDPGLNQPGVAGNVGGVARRSVRR
jgi:hypothetical protein